jgi:segregation and condensation protein B
MSDEVKIPLPQSLQEIVGSLLFASETPLTVADLRESVRAVEAEEGENREIMDVYASCTTREIEEAIKGVEKALEVAGCGFRLVCTGGTYRLQTVASCGRYVRAMLKLDRPSRLGRASLETLAIIAYRQPITKSEMEEIRGVDVTGNVKTLMDLQLIRLVGKSELPGHPFLYGTTPLFLEHFGLANLQQLNELDPTLQRSNPRLKAESYKKKETKTELEKAAEEAAAAEEAQAQENKADEKAEGKSAAGTGAAEIVQDDLLAPEEGEGTAAEEEDDDGIFIDDTPDEFDDEDDDDDEEGEEEDDEEVGDGADDSDDGERV